MRKRMTSLFLVLALCLTMLPATALAEDASPAGQETQSGTDVGDVRTIDETAIPPDDEKMDEAVQAAQALIDALPDEAAAENAEEIEAQLIAIDEALEALTDEQMSRLDITRYENLCEALNALTAVQTDVHSHPICGQTCGHDEAHTAVTWTALKMDGNTLMAGSSKVPTDTVAQNQTAYLLSNGSFYLTSNLTLDKSVFITGNVNLDLNGFTLTVNDNGYAIIVTNPGSVFNLCDCSEEQSGAITHGTTYTGSGVYVSTEFHMYGGSITGNKAEKSGGGVYVNGGTFTMSDNASITKNTANSYGGGVYNTGTFTMSGGSITGNKANNGGGVYNYTGTFTMSGGSITDNKDTQYGGGVYVYSGAFNLSGGTISGNTAKYNGGGVYNYTGTFTMSGGSITSNKVTGTNSSNGGGVYNYTGTFTMSGGSITGNSVTGSNNSTGNGGGVNVNSGTFELNSGTISGNTANRGGGVCVTGGAFNMSGSAKISGNSATQYGGGVYMDGGTFTMSGSAAITGNTAKLGGGVYAGLGIFTMSGSAKITGNSATQYGGGIYKNSGSSDVSNHYVYLSDSVQVKDNWQNGTLDSASGVYVKGENSSASNFFLSNIDWIIITGTLTDAASIGITTSETPTDSQLVYFAGYKKDVTPGENDTERFTSDAGHIVTKKENSTGLFLKLRSHVWTYTADAATHTITAQCSDCGISGGSVTLQAPAEDTLTYDGRGKAVTVENHLAASVPAPSLYYEIGGSNPSAALEAGALPINAGTYTALIIMGTGDNRATTSVTYTIQKAAPKAGDFTFSGPENPVYDGNMKVANIKPKSGISGMGQVVLNHYFNNGIVAPINAGNYTVKIEVREGANYQATTTQLTADGWAFTIQPREVTLTWADYENRTYGDGKTVTATAGNLVNGDEIRVTVTDGNATAIGTHTATATGLTGGKASNYKLPANKTQVYTIAAAEQNLTFTNSGNQSVTYGGTLANPATNNRADNGGSTVTYSSSNTDIAAVDENGTVTAKKVGTVTITATAAAVDGKYSTATANYKLTVTPKTLTEAMLQQEFPDKVYTGFYIQPEIIPLKDGDATLKKDKDYTVSYGENFYVGTGTVTIQGIGNYTGEIAKTFKITQADPTYTAPSNLEATYGQTLENVALPDNWSWDNPTQSVGDVSTGTRSHFKATYTPDNSNYKTVTGIDVDVKVNKAAGRSLGSSEYTVRFTDSTEHPITLTWNGLPTGQNWNYNSSVRNEDVDKLSKHDIAHDGSTLTYALNTANVHPNDTIVFTLTASCNNYEDFTYTVTVNLTDRNTQSVQFENGLTQKTVTYGDENFTIPATAKTAVAYFSSNTAVATVDTQTGEVTIVGAGDATIKATASETDDYAEATATYTLTVNKLRITVPTAGKNELVYNGKEQTYTPDGLDATYCEITSNTAKDVYAGGAAYKANVSLRDKANTEWDEGQNNTSNKEYPFHITPAPATVTVQNKNITAGQPAPKLTNAAPGTDYTVTGLFDGDSFSVRLYYADLSDLSREITPDTTKAGTYAIVATYGGTDNPNYNVTFQNGTLTIANRSSSGGGSSAPTYPVTAPSKTENGSVSSNVKNASKGSTVTITVTPENGYALDKLTVTDSNGNELKLTDKGNGKYTFTMPASKVAINTTFAKKAETSPFRDVDTDAYYYEAVKWAADKGITGGIDSDLFGPKQHCTRAQMVAFLWRAAGSPEPKTMSSFTDVPADSYYAKAVAWAVENGITIGTSPATFSPDEICTRAHAVTFLARAMNAKADGKAGFTDVPADSYYANSVAWAVENSVANGVGDGLFAPHSICTRAQIVTFLYRLYGGK